MDAEQMAMVQGWIEEAVKPLRMAIEALSAELEQVVNGVEEKASDGHYHDEYASVAHVERSESDVKYQLSRLRDDIDNVRYEVREVGRKAERAQSTADNASRSGRGYY